VVACVHLTYFLRNRFTHEVHAPEVPPKEHFDLNYEHAKRSNQIAHFIFCFQVPCHSNRLRFIFFKYHLIQKLHKHYLRIDEIAT
jgi:hypothetical protein